MHNSINDIHTILNPWKHMCGYMQNVCQSGLHFANIEHSFSQTLILQF